MHTVNIGTWREEEPKLYCRSIRAQCACDIRDEPPFNFGVWRVSLPALPALRSRLAAAAAIVSLVVRSLPHLFFVQPEDELVAVDHRVAVAAVPMPVSERERHIRAWQRWRLPHSAGRRERILAAAELRPEQLALGLELELAEPEPVLAAASAKPRPAAAAAAADKGTETPVHVSRLWTLD